MKNILSYFLQSSPKLFSFAHALLPDVLQAQQLVIDSIALLVTERKEWVEETAKIMAAQAVATRSTLIQRYLYRHIFLIGRTRAKQLMTKAPPEYARFYNLPITSRAVLFLHHQTAWSIDDIDDILSLERPVLFAHLQQARQQLLEQGLSWRGEVPFERPRPYVASAKSSPAAQFTASARCLETRKLLPYLDAQRDPAWRQQYASLTNHIVHCPQCQQELQALEKMLAGVEDQIPVKTISPIDQENLSHEITEVMQEAHLKNVPRRSLWRRLFPRLASNR